LEECNLRCQSRDAVHELNFASDNSSYKSDSSDDESKTPTVGFFTYNNYKNVIDFNIISVHITKEGKRDFVIVDFDWYGTRKTLDIPFDKLTGSSHEQIFRGMHHVDHGYAIIDKVDPLDGTIYWRFKTIHNHSPEDDTVLVEWYGTAEQNNMSWIEQEDLCEPYCKKDTWRMRSSQNCNIN
jgi:hypothetical protein